MPVSGGGGRTARSDRADLRRRFWRSSGVVALPQLFMPKATLMEQGVLQNEDTALQMKLGIERQIFPCLPSLPLHSNIPLRAESLTPRFSETWRMLWSGSFASQIASSLTSLIACSRLSLPHPVLILDVRTPEVPLAQDRLCLKNRSQALTNRLRASAQ